MKKLILSMLLILCLSVSSSANVAQELISVRAEQEKTKIENIFSRFRSWYQFNKINNYNPDELPLPADIFGGDMGYLSASSYNEGVLTLNLTSLPVKVLDELRTKMKLYDVDGNIQSKMARDGSSIDIGDIDTSNLILRSSGGTFLPGANLTFTSGGISMPSSTTLNVQSINVNGIDIKDMSGMTFEDITLKNITGGGSLIAGTTDSPMPFKGTIRTKGEGTYGTSTLEITDDRIIAKNLYSLGKIQTPYMNIENNIIELRENVSIPGILNISDNEVVFGDTTKTMSIYGKYMNIGGTEITLRAPELLLYTNNIIKGHDGADYNKSLTIHSDVIFDADVAFLQAVNYQDYVVAENMYLSNGKKIKLGDSIEIYQPKDSDYGLIEIKNGRVIADSVKINGKNVLVGDAQVHASVNQEQSYSKVVTGTGDLSLNGLHKIDLGHFNNVDWKYVVEIEGVSGISSFSVEYGVRNVKTEIPISALPNLSGYTTKTNTKTINAQLYLPDGETGMRLYITKLKVPFYRTIQDNFTKRYKYKDGCILDESGSVINIARTSSSTYIYDNEGNILPLLIKASSSDGFFDIWQPYFIVTSNVDLTTSDIYVRKGTAHIDGRHEYVLTEKETLEYYDALNSGDYIQVHSLPHIWMASNVSIRTVAFITIDENYISNGITVNNLNKLYMRAPGTETQEEIPVNINIPMDEITITGDLKLGTETNPTTESFLATVEYNNMYWKNIYEELDIGTFNITSSTVVANPSYTNNIASDCSYVFLIAPKNRYNDVLVSKLFSGLGINSMTPVEKTHSPTAIQDLIFPYGSDYTYYSTRSLFQGFSTSKLRNKLYDVSIDINNERRLVLKAGLPATINLVKNVINGSKRLRRTKYTNLRDNVSDNVYMRTKALLPTTAKSKFLRYDLYQDRLIVEGVFLPMRNFMYSPLN